MHSQGLPGEPTLSMMPLQSSSFWPSHTSCGAGRTASLQVPNWPFVHVRVPQAQMPLRSGGQSISLPASSK